MTMVLGLLGLVIITLSIPAAALYWSKKRKRPLVRVERDLGIVFMIIIPLDALFCYWRDYLAMIVLAIDFIIVFLIIIGANIVQELYTARKRAQMAEESERHFKDAAIKQD